MNNRRWNRFDEWMNDLPAWAVAMMSVGAIAAPFAMLCGLWGVGL